MTATTAAQALKTLREGLRSRTATDIDALVDLLQACARSLDSAPADETTRKAIQRYLPSIQIHLVTETIPTFYHALDDQQRSLLDGMLAPRRLETAEGLRLSRWIALTSYLTLPSSLNASSSSHPALPIPSRQSLIDLMARLVTEYGIDEMYWAVWADTDQKQGKGERELAWEEVTKALASVPAKCANAVGRWNAEGWDGDLPAVLEPKPFFDRMTVRLERVMYELSLATSDPAPTGERIRTVIQRLASLGLLTNRTTASSRQPAFVPALLPGLLAHLYPGTQSSLPAYAPGYLPDTLLPLPTSTLAAFVASMLQHLPARLPAASEVVDPSEPSAVVRRLAESLRSIVGEAALDSEAWPAMLQAATSRSPQGNPMNVADHVRARMVVAWVRSGYQDQAASKVFLDHVVQLWTDPKSIKFSLYSQQFDLTHFLLLSLSALPPYSSHLIAISHRAEFLIAVQSFLAHPDAKIRRLGMLVAEIVSELTIHEDPDVSMDGAREEDEIEELKAGLEAEEAGPTKQSAGKAPRAPRRLRFDRDMWDGEGEGKEECRWLRSCVGVNDLRADISNDSQEVWMFGWDQTRDVDEDMAKPPAPTVTRPGRGRAPAQPKPKPQPKARPKVVMLDEDQQADTLQGYEAASPSSSRSPSPTPSYLEEVAADPTLALDTSQKKKITRPVYVQQLIALLKEREKPEHIEMGLKWGEGLVRAKRSFGTELSENATNLALVTLALNDPFNLDDFDGKRQGLLNALVACAPKQVGPYLSEQYFEGQYSLQQKSVLLTALAMGARELAGLSVPQAISTNRRIDFPTKTLPPALHQKYIGPNDIVPGAGAGFGGQLEDAIGGVRDLMLSKGARQGEDTVPELARQKRLRVGTTSRSSNKVAEIGSLADRQMAAAASPVTQPPVIPYKDVAAECFIMPLINRFWQYFQDSSIRESRAIGSGDRYRGAGTGMVLSALALEKLLTTLSLLLHAARHSSAFLSVLAPEALELGVTIGARHLPSPSNDPFLEPGSQQEQGSKTEAQVLASALELVLVSLDASVELDTGRTLAIDKPELILAVGEWATGVFEVENRGGQVSAGQGGAREGRVRATAAGVVVKIAEIGEKWVAVGRMMR